MFALISLEYRLVPLQDTIIQALSSRVVKQIILSSLSTNSIINKLASSRIPNKPIKFSLITSANGYPLWGDGSRPLMLHSGTEYGFRVVVVDTYDENLDTSRLMDELTTISGVHRIYGLYAVNVDLVGALVKRSEELGRELAGNLYFKVNFKSPTLLQYPKHPRLNIRESINALYPYPMLLVLSLVKSWNSYEKYEKLGVAHAIYAPYELREVDHRIKPVTVHMGDVKERGFIGWIIYGLRTSSSRRMSNYVKLLELANYVGVGRSTTMGLGSVNVTAVFNNTESEIKGGSIK
ncbi:CRISPR system precrRNA processing endoribonuclease RAMP protein Cas6 [Caldivirga sp. UBA161]|uniref:CRISPR system precrRNA processing endoribonuclease RAMP protein Cas6 n=1 Tax=Caldivirga sp. UBA161 TaxID=1915569 RepID=UPI0025BBB642|nr:CRISPR system precrRNA processing endoribonuclease RAMP protein Cas6 [Caldivirga sp. UBA161]